MLRRVFCKLLIVALAILGALSVDLFAQGHSEEAFERVKEVQERHTEKLMAKRGVVGTAIGLNNKGEHIVMVMLEKDGVPGIPRELEGVPVRKVVSGKFYALADPTARFPRPVPTGVSTGHPVITAGTIACRVKDLVGNVYALSNNHVYADENQASIGDAVIQPGTYDGGSSPADDIGTLHDYETIVFYDYYNPPPVIPTNTIDAAIASTTTDLLGYATPSDGYGAPESTTATASLLQNVQKYGRTTGLTTGIVIATNFIVDVQYTSGVARFVNQIIIAYGNFSKPGDSGSLIVTNPGRRPVGLLFAGSTYYTIANPIDAVLNAFQVTIDDGSTPPPQNQPPTAGFTYTATGLSVDFTDQSNDSDGTLVSWDWDFGDGATSTAQNPSHSYAASGTYTVTLTVTDNDGDTDSASQDVTVSGSTVNQPPIADFTYTATDLSVDFTDQSNDSDGTIVSWDWNFGDGTTSTTQNPSHTYAASGTYMVTLTVTDDDDGTDSTFQYVTVSEPTGGGTMHVSAIDMWYSTAGPNYFIYTEVTILDDYGNPVADAIVDITTTLPNDSTVFGSTATGNNGTVRFKMKSRLTGSYSSEVTNVTHASLTYNASSNVETEEILPVP